MKFKILFLLLLPFNLLLSEMPAYSAKYYFESDEISITGIREYKKGTNGDEIKFEASNLFASLFFSSKFKINKNIVVPSTYDIKIRPKFLNRDQSIKFNYKNNIINSMGINTWEASLSEVNVFDPLNVQIMIRNSVKEGLKKFNLNIVDMENGGYKTYSFILVNNEECVFKDKKYNCYVVERIRENSERKVVYYLADGLEFMFLKIIDSSPEKINTLELKEILSFG
tara:strand:+ start:87 stop:764 length:678 start_codon:yes stop_codon:yes gene_type:complete